MDNILIFGGRYNKSTVGKKVNKDAMLADKHIYHCTDCNQCWEATKERWSRDIHFYQDFPTYGKEKKQCPHCTPDKNANNENR